MDNTQQAEAGLDKSLFKRDGFPPLGSLIPTSLQHVLASFAGVITPAMMIASTCGFTPEQVLGPPRRGLKVVYATDTRPCAALEAAARDADLLCMDATYADDADLPKARLYGHTTCREAGALAAAAAVRRLWLTHYSAAVTDTAPGLAAARTAYPLALAGYDGMAQELEFDKE